MKRLPFLVVAASLLATGCAQLQPAGPLAADERYVCKVGSALKYRHKLGDPWPVDYIPLRPGGSCKTDNI